MSSQTQELTTDSECQSDSGTSSKGSRRRTPLNKASTEYKQRRERNNIAVKKSRSKSKMKTQETLERVNSLREENAQLEGKIQLLTKELGFLKDLFLAHAGSKDAQHLKDLDLSALLDDKKEDEENAAGSRSEKPPKKVKGEK